MTTSTDNLDFVDEKNPPNVLLVGRYTKSVAFHALRSRLPTIIGQILEQLSKEKDNLAEKKGQRIYEEYKSLKGNICKLKCQLLSDKEMEPFTGNEPDKELWNTFIASLTPENCTLFKACFLYSECYAYRKLQSFFEATTLLRDYDYFAEKKENSLSCCNNSLEAVIASTRNNQNQPNGEFFRRLLKLNLWGNQFDLALVEGKDMKQSGNPFEMIDKLDEKILCDDSISIWNCISKPYGENEIRIIDVILDNSGFEFFTDLILADYIIEKKLASKIRFHTKAMPWYLSDVTPRDFHWALNYLSNHCNQVLSVIGLKWLKFVKDGKFELYPVEYFWTSPYEYFRMKEINEVLYEKLGESHLAIFKGDLNHRKLISDIAYDTTESFKSCLHGFLPTNLCTLRCIKADNICGLEPGVAEELYETSPNWNTTGEYGVIQFSGKK